jgi:hypothetical protein
MVAVGESVQRLCCRRGNGGEDAEEGVGVAAAIAFDQ